MRHPLTLLALAAALALSAPTGPARAASIPEATPAPAWPESALRTVSGAPAPGAGFAGTGAALPVTGPADSAGVDWMWVTRVSLLSPSAVDSAVDRAREMGVRHLLVQVIGRGDAWYRSERLPRAEALGDSPADFDPLGRMLERAHAAGIQVHAWVNCCLVWSGDHRPADPTHVAREHPEWFAALPGGRSLLTLGPHGWKRLGIEGAFLSPSDERVRLWVAANVAEVVRRYAVDGVHLDYIRTPRVDAGYDGASRVGFAMESGVDRAHEATLPAAERTRLDSSFAAYQDRQVTAIVRAVRDSVEAIRPGLPLTAAVRPDPAEAARWFGQPWVAWLADGLLDRAFPMCYSAETQTVLDQLVGIAHVTGPGRVIPGIAVYNAPPTRVASHVKGARALGYAELALYSYDALFQAPRYWERLAELLTRDQAP